VVANGARVTVLTFSLAQGFLDAALIAGANVLGTVVAIIAKSDELSVDQTRLIHVAVTVVIETVAALLSRYRGVAIG